MITVAQWDEALATTAAKWGADDGARSGHSARWTCPLGTVEVALDLTFDGAHLVPRLTVCASATVQGDASLARRRLQSAVRTIEQAEGAMCELSHYRVISR